MGPRVIDAVLGQLAVAFLGAVADAELEARLVLAAAPAAGSADRSSGWAKAAPANRLAAIMVTAAIVVIFDTYFLLRLLGIVQAL